MVYKSVVNQLFVFLSTLSFPLADMDMEDSINYDMSDDEHDLNELDDEEDSDLQQTQSTQQASQQPPVAVDSHLWGYLQPCNTRLTRIDFWKMTARYTIGRNTESNQVVFPGFKISEWHMYP